MLSFVCDKDLNDQVHGLINDVNKVESKLTGPIDDDFWQGLNEPIDKLIGSIDNSGSGLVTRVVVALSA